MSDIHQTFDPFAPWHDFLNNVHEGIESGAITVSVELNDFDLAVQYAVGKLYDIGYKNVTNDMIFHMMKALTDVEFHKQ